MKLDTSRLGAWSELAFFRTALPEIEAQLAQETAPVFPPAQRVFAALERCQPEATKVIILGQDPYHTPGKADGLAFSIPETFEGRLDSLGNIFKEIESDIQVCRTRTDLSDWADQGVLLLNTALTVRAGEPGAHARMGWRSLVDEVLAHLARRPRAYLLWGKPAQKIGALVDPAANLKIETAHPSPLSAARGFFGARPFSKVNVWLIEQELDPIRWTDP